jgi:hypothetical protein
MIQVIITMDETTGQVNVNGPLANKFLIYGMLEMARDAIRDWNKSQESRIVPATTVPMVPRNGGG